MAAQPLPGPAMAERAQAESEISELQQEIARLRGELRLLRLANQELERVAVMDTLTPLFNRRYFITALNERINRRTRYGTRYSVLFVDINRLKYINDVHGHSAGDFAIMHAAQILAREIRSTDVAARLGGDEFAIILEEIEGDAARTKARSLEKALRDSVCAFGDVILPMSASIGFTCLEADDREEAVIERADEDMYARKRDWHDKGAA